MAREKKSSKRLEAIKRTIRRRSENSYGERDSFLDMDMLDKLGVRKWKSKEGDNFISVLPPPDPDADFAYDIFVHFGVGFSESWYLCPARMNRGPCPLCEEWDRLRKSDEYDPEQKSKYKELSCFPPRILLFILDEKDKESRDLGVQVYDAPMTVHTEILTLSTDRRTGAVIDISDPDDGKILVFSRIGNGLLTKYKGFSLEDREDVISDEVLNSVPKFEDVLKFYSYDHIMQSWKGKEEKAVEEARPVRTKRVVEEEAEEDEEIEEEDKVEERKPRRRAATPVEDDDASDDDDEEEDISPVDKAREKLRRLRERSKEE